MPLEGFERSFEASGPDVPAWEDEDMLLLEVSGYEAHEADVLREAEEARWLVSLTRQLSFSREDGEYDHMEAILADARFPFSGQLRALTRMDGGFGTAAQHWGNGGPLLGPRWVRFVEHHRAFRAALRHEATWSQVVRDEI